MSRNGFTLTEILIVISILTVLLAGATVGFQNATTRTRDFKRVEGVKILAQALTEYVLIYGELPDENRGAGTNPLWRGWEVSATQQSEDNEGFLDFLVTDGILTEVPTDPLNIRDDDIPPDAARPSGNFWFMYHFYNGRSSDNTFECNHGSGPFRCSAGVYYGCEFDSNFAVVGFKAAESIDPDNLQKAQCGRNDCDFGSGGGEDLGGPNACRNWNHEFDYSLLVPI